MAVSSSRGARSGLLPVVAGVVSALALTGAAVYTVGQASCGDGGQYIRHDNHVELKGSCVDGSELPMIGDGTVRAKVPGTSHSDYRQP